MTAAEKLFTSARFHEITMEDIALAAKVGKGTLYRYFKDKDDLFFQVATSGYDELHEIILPVNQDGDVRQQLHIACQRIKKFFDSRWRMFRMMQAEEARMPRCSKEFRKQMMQGRDKINDAIGQILINGIDSGEIRSDIQVKVLAAMLLGMLRSHAHSLPNVSPKSKSIPILLDLFLTGAGQNGVKKARKRKKT